MIDNCRDEAAKDGVPDLSARKQYERQTRKSSKGHSWLALLVRGEDRVETFPERRQVFA